MNYIYYKRDQELRKMRDWVIHKTQREIQLNEIFLQAKKDNQKGGKS